MRRVLLLVVAATLALTGCGGSDESSDEAERARREAETTTTTIDPALVAFCEASTAFVSAIDGTGEETESIEGFRELATEVTELTVRMAAETPVEVKEQVSALQVGAVQMKAALDETDAVDQVAALQASIETEEVAEAVFRLRIFNGNRCGA